MRSEVLRWLSQFDPVVLALAGVGVLVLLRLGVGYAEEALARRAWFGPRR